MSLCPSSRKACITVHWDVTYRTVICHLTSGSKSQVRFIELTKAQVPDILPCGECRARFSSAYSVTIKLGERDRRSLGAGVEEKAEKDSR